MIGLVSRALHLVRGKPLSIFMYHAVVEKPLTLPDYCFISADQFADQMAWLAGQRIAVRPLVEAVSALEAGDLKEPTVAITFDDGYRNNVEVALPALERHGLPATIFLTTGVLGGDRALWPSRLNIALMATQCHELEWRGTAVSLGNVGERAAALARLQEAVKREAGDNPEEAVAEIESALDVPCDPLVPRDSPFAMMDSADIARATASGLIEFGAHTVSHPILSQLDDARLKAELDESIDAVEALTGRACCSFAYPNGRLVDFDDRSVRHLSGRGVEVAVATEVGVNNRGIDRLRLRRFGIGPEMRPFRLAAAAYGLPLEAAVAALRG